MNSSSPIFRQNFCPRCAAPPARETELAEPEAFPGWLRRIVLSTALNARRRARQHWLPLDEPELPPVLDEQEARWSESQQRALARALLTLSSEQRRLCERYYFGGENADTLAKRLNLDASAVRKRLQRIRDQLRKEIEMAEKRAVGESSSPSDLPAKICELLARPRLVELPDNPVGAALGILLGAFDGFSALELPEQVDLAAAAQTLGGDAVYIDREKLQRIAGDRVLRYDLSLPLLLSVKFTGTPLRHTAFGKVYRREVVSATHIEAFHQLEVFTIDLKNATESYSFAGRVLDSIDRLLPRAEVRVAPTEYPMCARVEPRCAPQRHLARGDGLGQVCGLGAARAARRSGPSRSVRCGLWARARRGTPLRHRGHPQDRNGSRRVSCTARSLLTRGVWGITISARFEQAL